MNEIPEFKTKEEETQFYQRFDKKLQVYKTLMNKVKNEFIGEIYNYHSLPGTVLSEIHSITRDITYQMYLEELPKMETPELHFEDEFMSK
jgi:hypothetical protein